MTGNNNKSYYAIIPANVRYDENLTPNAKLLYGEITALCNERGYCWASNSYFAKLYKVSNTSISLWIKQLKDNGYIEVQQNYKQGTKEILNRYLSILKGGIEEILNTPPQENLKDNNTLINNTINNTYNKEKPEKQKSDYSDSFNIFYKLYNHPVNKQPAFKEWKKIDTELHQKIYNHVREYRSRGQGVDFPLAPNNYLKNKRWTEMIVEKSGAPVKPKYNDTLKRLEEKYGSC